VTSEAKRAANRANAARSTGPRSASGKQRSSRNAFHHGLTAALASPADPEVITLAKRMVGEEPDSVALEAARAQVEVEKARAILSAEIARAADLPLDEGLRRIELAHRYARRFMARRDRALAELERLRSLP